MGEGENGTNGESSTDSRTLPCVRYTADETLCNGELSQALRGAGGRKEAQDGGDICVTAGGLHCCMAETTTTLQNNCFPIKRKLKKKRKLTM